jgi:CubicO group peptidase (beta-lactamase class C family)
MNKLFSVVVVVLLSAHLQAQSLNSATIDERFEALLVQIADADGPAVSIRLSLEGDERSYAAALGRVVVGQPTAASPQDQYRIASMSKTFMGVALLLLQEDGILSLEDGLAEWLDEADYANIPNADEVTLYELVTMRSGIADYLDDSFLEAVLDDPSRTWTPREALVFAHGAQPLFAPGEGFDYSNTNYLLLHLVVEAATGQSLAEVFRERIFEPLGMKSTYTQGAETLPGVLVNGYEDVDGDGVEEDVSAINDGFGLGDGGLVSTTGDLVIFYRALFVDQTLLSEESLARLLETPQPEDEYGMGVEVREDERYGMVYGHTGGVLGFTGGVFYAPDLDAVAVALYANQNFSGDEITALFDLALSD